VSADDDQKYSTDHWYFIAGIDIMAAAAAKAIAVIGDSITDGRGSDTNKNNRWTDLLAARLQANAATAQVSVLNQGIGATPLVGTGTAAEARFNRDVLRQSGVKYALVYDGVNDIGGGATFASMKAVYDKMIKAAHAENLLIYGATILPFGGNSYYSATHETVRQQVNSYIKSGAFDGCIDFDAALTDNANPPALQATYAAWSQMDGLHPGPTGYRKGLQGARNPRPDRLHADGGLESLRVSERADRGRSGVRRQVPLGQEAYRGSGASTMQNWRPVRMSSPRRYVSRSTSTDEERSPTQTETSIVAVRSTKSRRRQSTCMS
jgi:lysophospholipase L1-like esterase